MSVVFVAGIEEGRNIRKKPEGEQAHSDEYNLLDRIAFKDMILVSREYFLENFNDIKSWAENIKSTAITEEIK